MNAAKLAYKPLGVLAGVVGSLLAGKAARRVWRYASGEEHEPSATDPTQSWTEIALAAIIEGAVFGLVKALVDRAGAEGFARATGSWPTD